MRIRTLRVTSLAGFATAGLVATATLWVLSRGIDVPLRSNAENTQSGNPPPPPSASVGSTETFVFEEGLKRPLFEESRRPFTKAVAAPAPDPASLSQPPPAPVAIPPPAITGLRLAGLYLSDGQHAALIVTQDNPAGQWLKLGEEIAGWKVGRISAGHVTLQSNGQSQDLQLYVEDSAKSVDQPE